MKNLSQKREPPAKKNSLNLLVIRKMLLVNLFLVCLAIGLGAANEQKVRNGTWVSEKNWVFNKKPNCSIVLSGSRLSTKFQPSGIMLNSMYKGIVANETNKWYYWEFNCVKNCFGVGITKNH